MAATEMSILGLCTLIIYCPFTPVPSRTRPYPPPAPVLAVSRDKPMALIPVAS